MSNKNRKIKLIKDKKLLSDSVESINADGNLYIQTEPNVNESAPIKFKLIHSNDETSKLQSEILTKERELNELQSKFEDIKNEKSLILEQNKLITNQFELLTGMFKDELEKFKEAVIKKENFEGKYTIIYSVINRKNSN